MHTLEHADGSGEVVDTASGLQGGREDIDRGDEIVGEAVVQVSLDQILDQPGVHWYESGA